MKVVVLISGGLDSLLALRWCDKTGYDAYPIHFLTPFTKAASFTFANVVYLHLAEEFIELVKRPQHGYGKNLNPCIDCRILMLKKAKAYLEETGCSFIVTGEVLSQRPMSQFRQTLMKIDEEAQVTGLVLRPLSGKLLPETDMEKKGWVDREQMLDIQGRSRKTQIALAREWGVEGFFAPAGGCLLTDRNFCDRLKDELVNNLQIGIKDVELLKLGRHFRLKDEGKLIVGRNEKENNALVGLAEPGDILMDIPNFGSPIGLLIGNGRYLNESAAILKKYSDARNEESIKVVYKVKGAEEKEGEILV